MRNILASILTSGLIASITLVSCRKDDTICYNNVTMGNIDGQTIVSDQGNTFDIVETPFEINLGDFEYGRVMLACDVLKQTEDKRYDIRLHGITSVLTKDAVKASTITDPSSELAVEDAIIIRDLWYGGGYLNLLIEFAQKKDSGTKHLINLIHDDTTEGYTFILRHNAYGEVPSEQEAYISSMGYVSFPISELIEGDEAEMTIRWKSHKFLENGEFDLYESQECSEPVKWKRVGYEHPKATTAPNRMARMLSCPAEVR